MWDIEPSWDSSHVLTACADGTARLFDTTTGEYIARMPHKGVVRCVKWGDGPNRYATASDPFTSRDLGQICIFNLPVKEDLANQTLKKEDPAPVHLPLMTIEVDDNDKATCMGWTIGKTIDFK